MKQIPRPKLIHNQSIFSGLAATVLSGLALIFLAPGWVEAAIPAPRMPAVGLKLNYVPVKKSEHMHLEKMLKDSKLFDRMIADTNQELIFPIEVPVNFVECEAIGEKDPTNAFYDPEKHDITMCYELMAKSEELFRDDEASASELSEAVLGSMAWTFYHEMGHALIDIFKIPLTGKNEDAADQVSTYILLKAGEEGEKAALSGAEDFYREASEDKDLDDIDLADSHSLDKQRFYNIICWVYGTDEEKYSYLLKDMPELKDRAESCQEEFEKMNESWAKLLAPHTRK
jgi:hypothetical protein